MSIIQRGNNMRSLPRIAGILFTLCASATAFADTPRTMKIGVLNDASGPYSDNAGEGSVTAAKMAAKDFLRRHPDFKVEIISADHHRRRIDAALARFPERQTRGC